jgi:hypothetical protein
MSALYEKFQSSFKESALIAAVAAVGTIVGADAMVARTLGTLGVTRIFPQNMQGAVAVFGIVFIADMVYNLALA